VKVFSALRRLQIWRFHRLMCRRGWFDNGPHSDSRAVFIGGCPRSGTTVLREILHRHPRFFCGVETAMLVPMFDPRRVARSWRMDVRGIRDLASSCSHVSVFADRFYRSRAGKDDGSVRWVDKAPSNARIVSELLSWFPNGRFVHVVRDGRDVVCSLRCYPHETLSGSGTVRPVTVRRSVGDCAMTWRHETSQALPYREHPRYHEVRYEDLITRPAQAVESLCAFLGEDFHEEMLHPGLAERGPHLPARLLNNPDAGGPLHSQSIGRWRYDLCHAEQLQVGSGAGELLIALGYEKKNLWA